MLKMIVFAVLSAIIEYVKYMAAYIWVFNFRVNQKKKYFVIPAVISCLVEAIIAYKTEAAWIPLLVIIMGLFIPLLSIEGDLRERVLAYLIIVSGISIIDMIGCFVLSTVFKFEISTFITDPVISFLSAWTSLVILTCIKLFRIIWPRKDHEPYKLSSRQYVVIGIGMVVDLLLLSGIEWILSGEEMTKKGETFWFFAISLSSFLFVMLSIWQIVTMNRAERFRQRNKYFEEYIELQESYIKSVISNDRCIRGFKHDILAHLSVIREFCRSNKSEELTKYLTTIEENSGLYVIEKHSGNTAVDAVLREIMNEAQKKQIFIQWTGHIPDEIGIAAYDLCTVTSNLLKNAVEATEKLDHIAEKTIQAQAYVYNGKLSLIIVNNTSGQIHITQDNHIETTKADKYLHGFGIDNVRNVVEKYHGSICYNCTAGIFRAEILL